MNVLGFLIAIGLSLAQLVGGLVGYRVRSRRPALGLALGVTALVLTTTVVAVSLPTFQVASVAGGIIGLGAIIRPWAESIARWLAAGGAVAWALAMTFLVLDAAGVI